MTSIENIKNIHFIGIGGISMSGLAEILINQDYNVSGSDIHESNLTKKLEAHGAKISVPHGAENVEGAELVVYTAAVKEDNPEIMRSKELSIPLIDRATFLGLMMKKYNYGIAISGCHGKTTTTSMVSMIFQNAKLDPTILVGGELDAIGGNVRVGNSEYFVTEACEYVESFLKFYPFAAAILNIEEDHLDYFKDLAHIMSAFEKFIGLIPDNGYLFINQDNENTVKVARVAKCNVITFGENGDADYKAINIKYTKSGYPIFEVNHKGESLGSFELSIPGVHNVYNALASIAISHNAGVAVDIIRQSLSVFKGTHRRFDIKGVKNNITVIDDYAHHPTEIKALLSAAKNFPHKRIWCIFQPHTYTRTKTLFRDFTKAFFDADEVIIADIYAAREKDTGEISSVDLVNGINNQSNNAIYESDFEEIASIIAEDASPGDLVLTVGAGNVTELGDMILNKINERV